MPILVTETVAAPTPTGKGRFQIRLIDAGEGSSAIYPPAVLQQAATERVFPAGTRIHMDHPRRSDEKDLPERSVKDWIGVLTENATYDPDTQALEAPAKIFRPYQVLFEDIAEYAGMSIRAYIETEKAPGKPVASSFVPDPHTSVDLVTAAGRGGMVLSALESARSAEASTRDRREQLSVAVKDAYQEGDSYFWVRDFDEVALLVWFEDSEERCWQQTFTVSDDDLTVTLTGQPIEVRPTTTYVPVSPAGQQEQQKGAEMPQIDEAKLAELTAAAARVTTLEAETAQKDKVIADQQRKLREADNLKLAAAALAAVEGFDKLPEPAQNRVADILSRDIPASEAGVFDQARFNDIAVKAITAEAEYLSKVAPADERIHGFGASGPAIESTGRRTHDAWGAPIKGRN